ncbi:ras-responsive element-binding protein 1-like [Centruroides sculpturatus]|uniref:ras-responsive element-binding protein 1-like n=2 Tax=Centruroides sculpturatus TaxID=218467 RepID=UPI000C6D0043|nr:ras-responsive element-binding protein 1-like [Centruroides sculpturatus]
MSRRKQPNPKNIKQQDLPSEHLGIELQQNCDNTPAIIRDQTNLNTNVKRPRGRPSKIQTLLKKEAQKKAAKKKSQSMAETNSNEQENSSAEQVEQIQNSPNSNNDDNNNTKVNELNEDNVMKNLNNSQNDYGKEELKNGEHQDTKKEKKTQGDKIAEEDTNEEPVTCPICNKVFETAHNWTVHVRQHSNSDNSHCCPLCGKVLSSSSSLDRHMLVHSGKRPFKCRYCEMAFTTNGNMHRHMRTHSENDDPNESTKIIKEPKLKRKYNSNDSIPILAKKCHTEEINEDQEKLYCPVCGKTFLCSYGLQTHMDTHPNDPIQCQECGDISSNYNIYRKHKCCAIHEKKEDTKPKMNNNIVPVGFQDLTFIDFSTKKFSLIAKSFCEHNRRRPSSAFHTFECLKCKKAFPCGSALNLHGIMHRKASGTYCPSCNCDFLTPASFQVHQLKHRSAEHCSAEDNGKKEATDVESKDERKQSEKEDFLALLELQSEAHNLKYSLTEQIYQEKEDTFESISYFTHGKVEPSLQKMNVKNTNGDFADVQEIITVTAKSSFLSDIQTTPVAVSPASPNQNLVSVLPESPLVADSASPDTPSKEECDHPSSVKAVICEGSASMSNINSVESFSCSFCKQSFKNSKGLKRHNRLHKQNGSTFTCHLCPYNSVDKSTLIRHLRTHNGERPFQCAICKFAFTTKANCERHVRKRHKKITKQEIRNSMEYNPNMSEVNSPEILMPEVCGSAETVCKYCNVNFKFNRVLRHHLRSLNNSCSRKPFFCNICKLGFSTKNNCIRHVLRQHQEMRQNLNSVVMANVQNETAQHDSLQFSDEHSQNEIFGSTSEPLNLTTKCLPILNETIETTKDDNISMEDVVSAATSLVNLSQLCPPQEKPLDLAVHALDLRTHSRESLEKSSRPVSIYSLSEDLNFNSSPPSSYFESPTTQLISEKVFPSVSNDLQPLCLVSNTICNAESPIPEVKSCNMTFKMVNERLSFRNQRVHTCMYCTAGFTLKSNMERHIKRKHPEYARPTRSRNYIPTLTSPGIHKQSVSTLSTKTRNALREVLSHKSHNLPISQNDKTQESQVITDEIESRQNLVSEDNHSTDMPQIQKTEENNNNPFDKIPDKKDDCHQDNSCDGKPENETATDLASVSAVIDTANSQEFKQYLLEVHTSEKCATPESSNNDEIHQEEVNSEACLSPDSNKNGGSVKKRSSYADSPNSVTCPFCSRKFPWSSSLRRHILTHTGQKPFKCPKCPIYFTTKSNCERHLMRKHGHNGEIVRSVPERPYKCNLCSSSTFSTQGNLKKHCYVKHKVKNCSDQKLKEGSDGERSSEDGNEIDEYDFGMQDNKDNNSEENNCFSLDCRFCDQSFTVLQDLLAHIAEHTEANLVYKCHLCDDSFTKRHDSINHLRISHTSEYDLLVNKGVIIAENKDLENSDCLNSISDQSNNNNNNNNNGNKDVLDYKVCKVVCIICFSRFWSNGELRRHMRIHTGERPFSCNICQRMFSMKNSMLRHQHKHFVNSTQSSTDDECVSDQALPTLSRSSQNSLLYLMYEDFPNNSRWNSENLTDSTAIVPVQEKTNQIQRDQSENNSGDLIQDLLGINDSKIMDKILDSADSAARLLGVNEIC